MRKKMLIIGIVILIVGIVMFSASAYSTGHDTSRSNTWVEYKNGEYISSPLNFSGQNILTYSYTGSGIAVVTDSVLPTVNSTNLPQVSISPTTSVGSEKVYDLGTGTYYIVSFSNSSPALSYTYLKVSNVLITGVLTVIGLILFIAGVIITIIGAVMKKKRDEK
ncbi:MAG: hypothetical protein QW258_02480 [Thermoplasmata archaeon]